MTDSPQGDKNHVTLLKNVPMIGREEAFQSLQVALKRTRTGAGGKIAIVGESGVGKTRLVHEIAEEAKHAGMQVVAVPFRGSALRPYEPMADLVIGLLDLHPTDRADALRVPLTQALHENGLAHFEPAFARLLRIEGSGPTPRYDAAGDIRPSSTIDGPLESFDFDATMDEMPVRFDLADMLRMMVDAVAARGSGAVLIFDDLDEAAEISRMTISKMMDGLETSPVLVIATFKPDAPPALLAEFEASPVALDMLTREQTLELGASLLGLTWLTTGLGDVLWTNTAGRPLLIEMLMSTLHATERIMVRSEDKLGSLAGDGPIPAHHDIIVNRIRRLSGDQLKTLLNAVVLGDGFRVGALGVLHENRREEELLHDLELLINEGLLERSGVARRSVFRFPSALVRDTLYESAPAERRAAMHAKAGEYYALPATIKKMRFESAVHHFLMAGDAERAMQVIDAALQKAYDGEDRARIMALYHEGIRVAASDPTLSWRQTEMAEILGDMYAAQSDYKQASWVYRQGDQMSGGIPMQAKIALTLLAADAAQAANMMGRLAGTVPMDYPDDLRWRLEAGLAWGLSLMGRTYDAVRRSRDSLGLLSSQSGFGSARTLMRATLGMALYYHGDQAEAQPHLESARGGYNARGDEKGVVFVNQVLIGMPRQEITAAWLDLVLTPLLRR